MLAPKVGRLRSAWQLARISSSIAGRKVVVSFRTKYAIPRHIKPEILKLATSRGQSNLRTVAAKINAVILSFR